MSFNVHADDIIMDCFILGKTDCFPIEPFEMGSKIQILTLNSPSIFFSHDMEVLFWKQLAVSRPIVSITQPNG